MKPTEDELFEQPIIFPDIEYMDRFNSLVGLDQQKLRLGKLLSVLISPGGLQNWAKQHHPSAKSIIHTVLRRPPLVILEGDVGSGKSELAATIGDDVARREKIAVTLLPMSLSTRGQGHVGEMTKLLSAAFNYTIEKAKKLKTDNATSHGAVILLVDEADALTQSRESSQMHHEDKAGVNAFIRGIDRLGNGSLPAAVVMCTNRVQALDPAIKRRAADILQFGRPNEPQRRAVLTKPLKEMGFNKDQVEKFVAITGNHNDRDYGLTFSDLTQRLLPAIVLDAYPNGPVDPERALEIALSITPTPPFKDY